MRRTVLLGSLLCACAPRPAPYGFHGPVLSGVRAPELPRPAAPSDERRGPGAPPGGAEWADGGARRGGVGSPDGGARAGSAGSPDGGARAGGAGSPDGAARAVGAGSPDGGGRGGHWVAGLPALRAHVGARTRVPSHVFALSVIEPLGVSLRFLSGPPEPTRPTGTQPEPAFVDAARRQGAFDAGRPPRVGDLVVFDRESLVGVATAIREDGTVEFVYARGGVVRRGFFNLARPSERRDEKGRVLNTFVRAYAPGDPREQKYLAGELYLGAIRTAPPAAAATRAAAARLR